MEVELRPATGADDMLLLEGEREVVETSIALAGRLVRRGDGGALDAASLPVPDVEALLLELRRRLFGDVVASRARCTAEGCGAPADVGFRISRYVAHWRARVPASVEPVEDEPAWYRLRGKEVQFRLVTAGDLAAAVRSANPERELARRTIRADSPEAWQRGRQAAERAMEALAPALSGEIEGRCPECGAAARYWFDAQRYVQRELRYDAEFLYEDVHLLAARYHWTEEAILALPRVRRGRYVEMALRAAGGN